MALYPVIMAGGSGTRFWPLSRKAWPKQFLALTGKDALLVETAKRLKGLSGLKSTYVVCGKVHAGPAAKLLKGLPKGNVVVEPEARNTAPAIALATAHVARRDPQGVIIVLPSDQHVGDVAEFTDAVKQAVAAAEAGSIVTLGIKPTRPETGYGYIQAGQAFQGGARKVKAFVEKPNVETAQRYLKEGSYLWNAGIFVFRADVMLAAFKKHMPELFAALGPVQKALGTPKYQAVLAKAFARMPATSIDYGIAEKASNMAVVPCDCGWSDVGSFNALSEVQPMDANGNVVRGKNAIVLDSSGCVVWGSERAIAVVGMKDTVVIDAGDALLVLPKDKSQDVRKAVEALKARKLDALL